MKKSVIILIGIVYILGLVLVNSFGLKIAQLQTKVYVETLEFTNDDIYVENTGIEEIKRITLELSENPTYQLEWEYTPEDATETKVVFSMEGNKGVATIDENGLLTFNKKGTIIVYIRTVDVSAKSDTVTIRVR